MIAKNYDEFMDRMTHAIQMALNTPTGQELVQDLLQLKLKENPHMSQEEWSKTKAQFMVYVFHWFVTNEPGVMQELAGHVWEALQNGAH